MKRSPFQCCLLPPALTAFKCVWGPNVTPCRCLSCLLAPARKLKKKKKDEATKERETEKKEKRGRLGEEGSGGHSGGRLDCVRISVALNTLRRTLTGKVWDAAVGGKEVGHVARL